MNILKGPYPRFRMYTRINSYWWFFRDLILGRINKGDDVEKLEEELANRFKISKTVCVPQARVGIYLVLKNLIKPGQEVIMSPYTVADIVNMVICAGGIPIFVDINEETTNIDINEVEKLINDKTGAVLITHLHGLSANAHEFLKLCERHNLPLIEDTAQAFGGFEKGKHLGTIGHVGILSLSRYKNINAWYGGAVISNDVELIDKIKGEFEGHEYFSKLSLLKRILNALLKDILTYPLIFKLFTFWIFRFAYLHDIFFINRFVEIELDLKLRDKIPGDFLVKYTPFQARLILSQLDGVDSGNMDRIEKARMYYEGLKDIPRLIIPPMDEENIYPVFPIQYEDRKKLLKYLMKNYRDVTAQHLKNSADLNAFKEHYRDCPIARKTSQSVISLPTYVSYPKSEVEKNIEVIKSFFKDN